MTHPFVCNRCGDSWATDPRLIIPCPVCRQKAGSNCIRPSGHYTTLPHSERRKAAFELNPCSCLRLWEERQPQPTTQEVLL
jgi:hypothetical protein